MIGSAIVMWDPVLLWAIAVDLEADPAVSAAVPPAPAVRVVLPACVAREVAEALVVAAVPAAAAVAVVAAVVVVVEGGNK